MKRDIGILFSVYHWIANDNENNRRIDFRGDDSGDGEGEVEERTAMVCIAQPNGIHSTEEVRASRLAAMRNQRRKIRWTRNEKKKFVDRVVSYAMVGYRLYCFSTSFFFSPMRWHCSVKCVREIC